MNEGIAEREEEGLKLDNEPIIRTEFGVQSRFNVR
jgi:hypothetical protein